MGCVCTKKNEISNVNLQESNDAVPQIYMSHADMNDNVN